MDRNWLVEMSKTFTRSDNQPRGRRAASRRRPAIEGLEGRLLLTDGLLDPNFGVGGRADISFNLGQNNQDMNYAMAVQPLDGKIVLVGSARTATTGDIDFVVTRLNANGTLDTNFGTGGRVLIDFDGAAGDEDVAKAVAIAPDGKIVVAGHTEINGVSDFDFAVARLNENGTLDTTFNGTGKQHVSFNGVAGGGFDLGSAVAVQADKKILVGGTAQTGAADYDFGVARLNEDGSLDANFGVGGKQTVAFNLGGNNMDTLNAITLSGDKVVLAGYVPRGSNGSPGVPAAYDFAVARLTANGTLDPDFDGDGKTTINVGGNDSSEAANGVTALTDGRIVVVGQSFAQGSANRDFAVTRLQANGSPDPTFNGDGRTTIPFDLITGGQDIARAVTIDSDNRIVVAGEARSANGDADMAVLRLKSDGTLDPNFGVGGKQTVAFNRGGGNSDIAYGVGIQPGGKIVLAGSVQANSSGDYDFGAARLESSAAPTNRAPVATDDTFAAAANTPLNIPPAGVLANDTDADNDTLTAAQVSGPSHGNLTLNTDGSFTYTPVNGFSGQDSFTYTAGDGVATSNTATVTINVAPPPNHAPVAGDDAYETPQNTPLLISGPGVLANDTDADSGDPRLAVLTSLPAHGTVTLNHDGAFLYTPAPGYSGPDSFHYVVSDNKVASNTATVTINVRDTTPPQALSAHLVRTRTKVGRRRVTTLTLQVTFNEAMNPALAGSPAMYGVSEIKGTRKRVKYSAVAVSATTYDAATHTVSLTLSSRRRFNKGGRLTILPNVTDLAGNLLDGNRTGVPGVMASLLFPKG